MHLKSVVFLLSLSTAAATPPVSLRSHQAIGGGQDSVTAFVHVAVIPMDRERVLQGQTVLVQGYRITALGPSHRVAIPAGAVQIDGRGKYLLPGLADMHAHPLDMIELPGMADRLFLYLANGVTTIHDMHSTRDLTPEHRAQHPSPPIVLKRQLMRGEVLGPRLYTAGDPDFSSPAAAARTVAELKADGYDFVKLSDGSRWDWTTLWPRSEPIYDSTIAAARRVGLPVVGHVPFGLDVTQLRAPWAASEHMYGDLEYVLGLNGRWSKDLGGTTSTMRQDIADTAAWMKPDYRLDRTRLRQLVQARKDAKIWTCPTLQIYIYFRELAALIARDSTYKAKHHISERFFPSVGERYLELELQIVKALQDGGAGLLLGTDGSAFDLHIELALLVEAGLTPYQALATGTRNVAQFLGTLDSTGTIAVGKRADLVLLSGNPLQDIGYTAGPAGVMIGGRWIPRAEIDARLVATERLVAADSSNRLVGMHELLEDRRRTWRH